MPQDWGRAGQSVHYAPGFAWEVGRQRQGKGKAMSVVQGGSAESYHGWGTGQGGDAGGCGHQGARTWSSGCQGAEAAHPTSACHGQATESWERLGAELAVPRGMMQRVKTLVGHGVRLHGGARNKAATTAGRKQNGQLAKTAPDREELAIRPHVQMDRIARVVLVRSGRHMRVT